MSFESIDDALAEASDLCSIDPGDFTETTVGDPSEIRLLAYSRALLCILIAGDDTVGCRCLKIILYSIKIVTSGIGVYTKHVGRQEGRMLISLTSRCKPFQFM